MPVPISWIFQVGSTFEYQCAENVWNAQRDNDAGTDLQLATGRFAERRRPRRHLKNRPPRYRWTVTRRQVVGHHDVELVGFTNKTVDRSSATARNLQLVSQCLQRAPSSIESCSARFYMQNHVDIDGRAYRWEAGSDWVQLNHQSADQRPLISGQNGD
ncbi:hypothetical protein ACIA8C_11980 [Nocardia sp. NPDC051321]|uniref:hypothetical protein n=1 Tax=Nocardia sp. NPDC051321 TaxID=3364323 RepID=UPI0037B47FE8